MHEINKVEISSSKEERKSMFDNMTNFRLFESKIVIIGFGSIGTSLIPILTKFVKIKYSSIFIIDRNKSVFSKLETKFSDINLINICLTNTNIEDIMINQIGLKEDDIIVDASYKIDTNYMYELCSKYGISYTNSALEVWEVEQTEQNKTTYHSMLKYIEDIDETITNKKNNFVVSMGCNPGNVNIWAIYALLKINKNKYKYNYSSYADLANKMGLRVIHVSENDSQLTNKPKQDNEYLNTWSSNAVSWYDEAFSYLELGWGTHEKVDPDNLNINLTNEYQKVVDQVGCESFAYTYTPINKITKGMLIKHEETYTMCRKLTLKDNNNKIIYKPSCYYVYKPCESSIASINEVQNTGKYQDNRRLMTNDIVEGRDEIGCTLFFENGDIYWVGSTLDIDEARELLDNKFDNIINATVMQVIAGYMGSIFYLIDKINEKTYNGLVLPEDMPIEQFIEWTKPFLGNFDIWKVEDWKQDKLQFKDFLC